MNISNFEGFFTSQDISHFVKHLSSKDSKPQIQINPQMIEATFECHIEEGKFDCQAGLELNDRLIYAFAKNKEIGCQIQLHSFSKQHGEFRKISFKEINGRITSMGFILSQTTFPSENPRANTAMKSKHSFKLVVGFKDGFLKVIHLAKNKIKGFRLDTKPIVSILAGNYNKFHNRNVCIVLSEDNYIYFVDIDMLESVYILRPNIVTCDSALSIEINQQYSYLMQTTKGGYIIFWKINQILNHFKNVSKNQAKKEYNVLPISVNHSLAINGLIACFFYGHILAMITNNDLLKLVAINVKGDQQFIILSEYTISQAEAITHACIYPKSNCILISKEGKSGKYSIQKLDIGQLFNVKKITKILVEKIGAIYEFYIPEKCNILMCRGIQSYGVGLCEELFSQDEESNGKLMDIQKSY